MAQEGKTSYAFPHLEDSLYDGDPPGDYRLAPYADGEDVEARLGVHRAGRVQEPQSLEEMTKANIVALAASEGIELDVNDRKDDLIAQLEEAREDIATSADGEQS